MNEKIWFTSDPHFGHGNIIKYCRRPFAPADLIQRWIDKNERVPQEYIDQMTEELIARYNARVGHEDIVYILGDFCFAKRDRIGGFAMSIANRLNGRKIFIPGNHDPEEVLALPCWEEVTPLKEIRIEGHKVTLCHYAMQVWNKAHHGAYQLFGHSHGNMPGNAQQMDVGVDANDYQPVSFEECLAKMRRLPKWASKDHHKSKDEY